MLAYLAVPVRFLFSLYGICWCVRASLYFLASPKSIIYTRFPFFPSPMRKLSGLTSRWMKFLECMYSILLICNKHKVMYIFCNFGQKCLKNNNTTAPRYNYYSIEDIFILKGIFKTLFFSQCPFVCLSLFPRLFFPLLTNWSASSKTVLRLNFLEQKLKRSSRLGPRSSITITL